MITNALVGIAMEEVAVQSAGTVYGPDTCKAQSLVFGLPM